MAGRLGPGVRGEHDVLVDQGGDVGRELQLRLPELPEIPHGRGRDGDRAVIADLAHLDAVVAVILHLEPEGLGLERHAGVLRHQDDRALGGVAEVEGGRDDPMVRRVDLHEDGAHALRAGAVEVVADERLVDHDAQLAAVAELGVERARPAGVAFGDLLQRAVLEERTDRPVDASGAGAELARLGLEPIELGEDLHRDRHGVFIELEEGLGVVNQYVGVQDVSLFHEPSVALGRHRCNL